MQKSTARNPHGVPSNPAAYTDKTTDRFLKKEAGWISYASEPLVVMAGAAGTFQISGSRRSAAQSATSAVRAAENVQDSNRSHC
jgi:hypothetical protein